MSQIQNVLPEDQFSFEDIVRKIIVFKDLIVANWKTILVITLLGLAIGYTIDILTKKPSTYTSRILFNMDNGTSGGGGLSDLASAFGIGGGSSPSSSLFSGENFFELLKTKNIYNRAILSKVEVNGKSVIFGNFLIEKSGGLQDEWKDNEEMKRFRFKETNYEKLTANERSKIRMLQAFLEPLTSISNDNKKSSLMTMAATTRNDTLSHVWTNLFLKTVTDFYIETKTKKTRELLGIMERRVDSLKSQLYGTQRRYAQVVDQNQQVIMQQGMIEQQRLNTNSAQLQGMYQEAVRNLDNLRFSMVKESPLFTRIDDSELPIGADVTLKGKGIKLGGTIGLVLALLFVAGRDVIQKLKDKKNK
ncbi:hypothetical protein [Cellulophaga sp. BC115SP]|uniref:hypothetical protein n=1 Tax=Cellulophaga sp. BC115SP TaxID=2683263 RepID=UPI0014132389|nr:hypothetical protein [Cellulophaga sp. BC115SP]NBB29296.1 hypothetical protein [Cellulophaga sp. BC115SP]